MNTKTFFTLILLCSGLAKAQQTTASFLMPDTACAGQSFTVQNTSTGPVNTWYWESCQSNPTNSVTSVITSTCFSNPVYFDVKEENGNYFMFVTNNLSNEITRLDFGNSLLNTPVSVNLGNPQNVLASQPEGIYLEKIGNNWYALVVGGTSPGYISRLSFGSNLQSMPSGTSLGNIGNLNYPHNLVVFEENNNKYALVINRFGNSLSILNFGSSILNTPTGSVVIQGPFTLPSQMAVVNVAGTWYAFVVNDGSNDITRLTFGNSLLNTPVAATMPNFNNMMSGPRGINISAECGDLKGYLANQGDDKLMQLTFPTGPTGSLNLSQIPVSPGLSFPQTIERYRQGSSKVYFIANVTGPSLQRIEYPQCNIISTPAAASPGTMVFPAAGTYTVKLTCNEGKFNASTYCKKIVIVNPPQLTGQSSYVVCLGKQISIGVSGAVTYSWNTGATTASISPSTQVPATYTVTGKNGGCTATKTISVTPFICDLITETESPTMLQVFPNPSSGRVTVHVDEQARLHLHDALGKILEQRQLNAGASILDLSDLPDGIYLLGVQTRSGSRTVRLTISHPD